jgi:hypothetical protein
VETRPYPPAPPLSGITELAVDAAQASIAQQLGSRRAGAAGVPLAWGAGGEPLAFLLLDAFLLIAAVLLRSRPQPEREGSGPGLHAPDCRVGTEAHGEDFSRRGSARATAGPLRRAGAGAVAGALDRA